MLFHVLLLTFVNKSAYLRNGFGAVPFGRACEAPALASPGFSASTRVGVLGAAGAAAYRFLPDVSPGYASNWTVVPPDPDGFERLLRNGSATYPITAQIAAREWSNVVLRYNYSRMGVEFTANAKALQEEVRLIVAERERAEALRKEEERKEREERKRRGGRGGRGGRWRGRGGASKD